jgi:hypothetical protein
VPDLFSCATPPLLLDSGCINPLLVDAAPPVVDPLVIASPVLKRRIPANRLIEDQRRAVAAAAAIAGLERDGCELVGLTRGQFSLTDLLEAVLKKTGPAALSISTWTAASASVQTMLELLQTGQINSCRWLVDTTFVRRVPALVAQIRKEFGADAIRVTRTHAKFATVTNDEWQVAIRSSMNLNQNPRLESYELGHDPQLCAWLEQVLTDVWANQPRQLAEGSHSDQTQWFRAHG